MQVQHPAPTAVHDGSCFQEEDNHEVAVQEHVPVTTKVEEAPGAEEVQVLTNGVSEEVEKTKGQEEDSKENPKKDDHEEEAAAIATEDAGYDECLIQAVAQDVEAKLGILQADAIVDDSAVAAAGADDEKKPPKEQEADERRREVPRKTAAAKAVVVPIDDDDDDLVDGEADAPAETASEATKEEDAERADKTEKLEEDKTHEE